MISSRNAFKLAVKKLNVRKGRTIISIFVASLLFGLIAIVMISLQVFSDQIFEAYQAASNGEVLLEVRGVPIEVTDRISEHNGKLLEYENYVIKPELVKNDEYDESAIEAESERIRQMSQEEFEVYIKESIKETEAQIFVNELQVVDNQALKNLSLVESKYDDTIPIIAPINLAAARVNLSTVDYYKVQEATRNLVVAVDDVANMPIKFEIIGLLPGARYEHGIFGGVDAPYSFFGLMDYGIYGGYGDINTVLIPSGYTDRLSNLYNLKTPDEDDDWEPRSKVRLIEFSTYKDAEKFAKEHTCIASGIDFCWHDERTVSASELYTSRFVIRDNNEKTFYYSLGILGFFIFISIIILGLTFSRIFIDEVKTSAIFQAVGATRADIFKVYLIYSLLVSVAVAILVQIIGYAGAFVIHLWQAEVSTTDIRMDLAGLHDSAEIGFIGFSLIGLLPSVAAIIGGLISFLLNYDKILAKNIVNTLKND